MTDRPIIFSAPMVRAMLDGRKTQTRRVLKEPAPYDDGDDIDAAVVTGFIAPKYRARDRLWVRETCATWGRGPDREPVEYPVAYAADDPEWEDIKHDARHSRGDEWKIRPSIHMPRWASRLTLIVTDVRVQRLQDISEADAIREGVTLIEESLENPRDAFALLWNSLHGHDAWDANPWVVAVSFEVHRCNIDQMGADQ